MILTKTGISTTGTTKIVGNIGVSPIAATAITGFGLIMDASNQFSRSSLVSGNVYAANYAPPTPTVMTTAIGDMGTAYTNAAGRTLPDYTELGAGNIGGMTLTPGLYKWGTGVIIPTDVTLSGNSNDVWIFQIAQTLDISSSKHVILSGGAQASNIFWQVAGQTTLGTTSVFNGNILCKTAIVLKTGATLNGRALAQTAVTLIANTITKPADITSPTVISTVPANAAKYILTNTKISATFSEAMNPLTLTAATFTLKQGFTPVSGVVSYAGVTATFTPTVNLAASTTYTAMITTGVKDLAGNALTVSKVWSFTTRANVIFSDSFESGGLSAWSGSSYTTGETRSVVTTRHYDGKYSAIFSSNGGGSSEKAYVYKTIASSSDLYARGYYYVSQNGIVEKSDRLNMVEFRTSGGVAVAYAGWEKTSAGSLRWFITIYSGTSKVTVYSSSAPALNTWCSVELHWKNSAFSGLGELYVNGVKVCSITGRNTNSYGSVTQIRLGLPLVYNCASSRLYLDSAVISKSYVGPRVYVP